MKPVQEILRYMKTIKELRLKPIQITSSNGHVDNREIETIHQQHGDMLFFVGVLSGCTDAKHITFNFPPLRSVWNLGKGERAVVNTSPTITYIDWGRSKKATATKRIITEKQAEKMFSTGRWFPENALGSRLNITMAVIDRSFKEQISMDALMSLCKS